MLAPKFWFQKSSGNYIPVNSIKGIQFKDTSVYKDYALPIFITRGFYVNWSGVERDDYVAYLMQNVLV